MALGMLEHTEIDDLDPDGADALHLQIEAMKLAFADVERHVGDPDAMRIGAEALLDPSYLAGRAALIDRDGAPEPTAGAPHAGGTVCLPAAPPPGMLIPTLQATSRALTPAPA